MAKLAGSVTKYPARASFVWYLGLILLGSLVLLYPGCLKDGVPPLRWIDALFIATSATCVTGLTTRTMSDFSPLGQTVVLILIQIGGIGILTLTTLVTLRIGKRAGLRQRLVLWETVGSRENGDLVWVLTRVVVTCFLVEFVGCVLLAARNLMDLPWPEAVGHAAFHSISAFCNAGFALYDDSLSRYRTDYFVNMVVMALIIVGGLGFPVLSDLQEAFLTNSPQRRGWSHLSLHTKLMLIGTGTLIVMGAVGILFLEWNGVLHDLDIGGRVLAATFHSVTCRTAGFNTIDLKSLSEAALLVSMLLMMIGAGPCSTAGGFKVTTASVLVLQAWATFRGQERINVFRRTIPKEIVDKSIVTAFLFGIVSIGALMLLLVSEQATQTHSPSGDMFMAAMFEVVSALGTVGLSTGLTTDLSTTGKLIIIGLMLTGRLGPISVFDALSRVERHVGVEHPSEEPLIG
jgi:trk system potassium uptake protein TrkH